MAREETPDQEAGKQSGLCSRSNSPRLQGFVSTVLLIRSVLIVHVHLLGMFMCNL